MDITELLTFIVKNKASDLHLSAGAPPYVRNMRSLSRADELGGRLREEALDMERREQFREEGAHFESRYYLTLLWMPPAEDASRAEGGLTPTQRTVADLENIRIVACSEVVGKPGEALQRLALPHLVLRGDVRVAKVAQVVDLEAWTRRDERHTAAPMQARLFLNL